MSGTYIFLISFYQTQMNNNEIFFSKIKNVKKLSFPITRLLVKYEPHIKSLRRQFMMSNGVLAVSRISIMIQLTGNDSYPINTLFCV